LKKHSKSNLLIAFDNSETKNVVSPKYETMLDFSSLFINLNQQTTQKSQN